MSERDELADLLWDMAIRHLGVATSSSKSMAEELIEAGYRKPRTITTAEELDALPVDTVIRTAGGRVYEKGCYPDDKEFPFWSMTNEQREFGSRQVPLPATVLWEPQP
jgi:SAM-dependent MidA family methyltransferase